MSEFRKWIEREERRQMGHDWHAIPIVHGVDRGMPIYDFPCSCGRTIRGTDRDRGKQCQHTDQREAYGIWCTVNGTWSCSRTDEHPRAACHNGRGDGIATCVSDLRPCPKPPQPPTLREWLGDRVSDLGRWAEVLREQPMPAGWISAWKWESDQWWFHDSLIGEWCGLLFAGVTLLVTPDHRYSANGTREALLMALFTRHPDVKPEPKPAAFPWDPYPEVV